MLDRIKKKSIIFLLSGDITKASSRYRGYYIIDKLKQKGIYCKALHGSNLIFYFKVILILIRFQVIYIQKKFNKLDIIIAKISIFLGKIVIFDIDDSPSGVKGGNAQKSKAIKLMKLSSIVITGSHELALYSKKYNSEVYVLNTPVKLTLNKRENTKRKTNKIKIGWIGNGINYRQELLFIYQILLKLSDKMANKSFTFEVIGTMNDKKIEKMLKWTDNMSVNLISDLNWSDEELVFNKVKQFDIGLYPILENEYNRFKGGFKLIQYSSAGVPFVASSVYENNFLESGGGLLVNNNEQSWLNALEELIEDNEMRNKLALKGINSVHQNYTSTKFAKNLIDIINNNEKSISSSIH